MQDSSTTNNQHHTYGTRIKKTLIIKPSVRPRSSPEPGPSKQSLITDSTPFPAPGIVLHPEDATSKVFLAIGRAFSSVDNRAMTIKDLAEMIGKFGLVCQNTSAASQAITTYIRAHMHRCEVQQDQPLLLRHILSGTVSDDDLVPGLYSRSGGASCPLNDENRLTNFRRGTTVWYLSRTTGAPCPFARAGIRLCDYGEDGKLGTSASTSKEKKRQRDRERREQLCGQKRKRPTRGCVASTTKDSDSESELEEEEEDPRPPKVKLTLRLRPLASLQLSRSTSQVPEPRTVIDISKDTTVSDSDEDEAMSVDSSDDSSSSQPHVDDSPTQESTWCLPPYPRRTISIPCYTPSTDENPYPWYGPPPSNYGLFRRSPSVTDSVGSPPPDSEDDSDDFHVSMTGVTTIEEEEDAWDADLDSEGDGETWESPGPRSPSAPVLLPEVAVKEEPTDVQGILEAWDGFDSSLAGAKMVEAISAHLAGFGAKGESTENVKVEELETWNWDSGVPDLHSEWGLPSDGDLTARIKQEEVDNDALFPLEAERLFGTRTSPSSPVAPVPGLSYSDISSPDTSRDDDEWTQFGTIRPRSKAKAHVRPSHSHNPSTSTITPSSSQSPPPSHDSIYAHRPSISTSLASLVQSLSMNSPTTEAPSPSSAPLCISPLETRCKGPSPDTVVVRTCLPCTPAICATQIEGISVYQMSLGSHTFLRRIDTDFVNLSPIVAHFGTPYPVLSTIPNSTTVSKGSAAITGTWVPLSAAQVYMNDHEKLQQGGLHNFLSETLSELFPTALREFHKSSASQRSFNQFGPPFGSMVQPTQLCSQPDIQGLMAASQSPDQSPPQIPLGLPSLLHLSSMPMDEEDRPLNEAEEAIFRTLCDIPDSEEVFATTEVAVMMVDTENSEAPALTAITTTPTTVEAIPEESSSPSPANPTAVPEMVDENKRPVRRSKRVAEAAIATQMKPRTRSQRGRSRNSLS